jgi:LAO/AO transport system ATPase
MIRSLGVAACAVALWAAPSAYAANGELAAVARGATDTLVTLNPDGSGLRALSTAPAGALARPAWSPSGDRIAFAAGDSVDVYDLPSGTVAAVAAGSDPAWTPDGARIELRRGTALISVRPDGGDPVALGGLAEAALQAALLMDAAGKDDVFLETVGVGQAEVDVIDHADSVVLVLIPGSGDSIQALKAGVMEIPDVIVVNKADHPLTDTMVREIRGVLSLAPHEGWRVPIVKTEATRGEGVELLAEKLAEHRAYVEGEGKLAERRRRNLLNEVLGIAAFRLRRTLEEALHEDPEVQELLDEVVARRLDPASAASAILARGHIAAPDAAR